MLSPLEQIESLCIGTVEFVSPDQIKISLNIEAPESLSLNTGTPIPFPRINGYVLIPNEDGYLVGQVEWLAIEKSPYPKRRGTQKDFGLVDLPYPLRKMSLNPVGILKRQLDQEQEIFKFNRGVNSFPSVGDNVLLPTQGQLHAVIESGQDRRVKIGVSPLADNAEVFFNPDRLFGRHLAVLGNTGSGKSCSVAGLIRWSLEAAQQGKKDKKNPNARFIVLDPNGEYSRAFQKDEEDNNIKARLFKIEPDEKNKERLQVPFWFWNSAEWCAFAQASEKTQRPTLIHALRNVRAGNIELTVSKSHEMRRFLRTIVTTISIERNSGTPWGSFPKPKSFCEKLKKWNDGGLSIDDSFSSNEIGYLEKLKEFIKELVDSRSVKFPDYDFTKNEIDNLLELARQAHYAFGGSVKDLLPIDQDIPRKFTSDEFLRSLEASGEILGVSEYIETMLIRIRALLGDTRMKLITQDEDSTTLADWLGNYIGTGKRDENITIIDLSLVPSEVIYTITAVIARMIFEALQRYRKLNKKTLPTVLVMEEAHTFIRRHKEDSENQDSASVCRHVFEKIAREGRKFGLGLVISSQRPSELSPTVLSQCNTFLLHRISNDRDQDLVHRFIPDNLKGLLRDLPSLPSQNAILMGWASELPVLVKINDLPQEQQPLSDDPDFWDVWTGTEERSVYWESIADDWQEKRESSI